MHAARADDMTSHDLAFGTKAHSFIFAHLLSISKSVEGTVVARAKRGSAAITIAAADATKVVGRVSPVDRGEVDIGLIRTLSPTRDAVGSIFAPAIYELVLARSGGLDACLSPDLRIIVRKFPQWARSQHW